MLNIFNILENDYEEQITRRRKQKMNRRNFNQGIEPQINPNDVTQPPMPPQAPRMPQSVEAPSYACK